MSYPFNSRAAAIFWAISRPITRQKAQKQLNITNGQLELGWKLPENRVTTNYISLSVHFWWKTRFQAKVTRKTGNWKRRCSILIIFSGKLDFRRKLPEKRVTKNDDGRFWTFLAKNLIWSDQLPENRVTKNGIGRIFTFSAKNLISGESYPKNG